MHWASFRIGLLLQLALNVLSQQISVTVVQQDPTDMCEQDCSERHDLDIMAMWSPRGACQQGCRFFTLASLMRRFGKNLADTVTTCQESCLEAYTSNSNGQACVEACGVMQVITERSCHGQDIQQRSMSPIKQLWDDVSKWFLAGFNENSNREPEFGQEFGHWEIRDITIGQVDSQDGNLFVVDMEIMASDSNQPEVWPLPEVLPEAEDGVTPEWQQWHTTIVVRNTLYSCLSKRLGIPQYLIGAGLFILATVIFHSCIVFCTPGMLKNVSNGEKMIEEDQLRNSLPPSYYSIVKIPLENDEVCTKETQFLLKETCPDQYHNVPIVPVHRM